MGNISSCSPKKVYVELTTRCNLQCEMCVKHMAGSTIVEADMSPATFDRLLPELTGTQSLILNGIGEPLLHPELIRFVAKAAKSMASGSSIGFQTNGLLLDEVRCRQLFAAGLGTICLSVDSLTDKGDGCGVPGGSSGGRQHSFSSVQRALNNLHAARKEAKETFRVGLEIVLTRDNYRQLPRLVQWAVENGVEYVLTTNLILYDTKSERESLFNPNFPWAIEVFGRYQAKARGQGIDLEEVFRRYRRFAGTRTKVEEAELLSQFQQEARIRDVRLNLEGLFRYAGASPEDVDQYFGEASEIAERHGLELFLPPLQALEPRSCPFVEDHAACISVNGDVMPCHFLWHSYSCRVLQEEIQVQERIMGNIDHSSLGEIWQQREFQQFRREAGEYDYAACWSCSMAPCTNLVNENASGANDCYGSQVPCGHCQWGLGGIRCL